jgi:hypothetical protein
MSNPNTNNKEPSMLINNTSFPDLKYCIELKLAIAQITTVATVNQHMQLYPFTFLALLLEGLLAMLRKLRACVKTKISTAVIVKVIVAINLVSSIFLSKIVVEAVVVIESMQQKPLNNMISEGKKEIKSSINITIFLLISNLHAFKEAIVSIIPCLLFINIHILLIKCTF